MFQKSSKKKPSFERPKRTLAQIALSSNQYVLKKQRLQRILAQKSGFKSTRMAKVWKYLQGHPKPAFSDKVERGDEGKFFKNRKKPCCRLKGPNALLRKWYYPLISMLLTCRDWNRCWRRQRLQNCPNWPSYGNFRKVTQKAHFLKTGKGGTKENFSKIAQKVALA